ncbi:MAG TPA: PA0069 family radical SAM protein [Alphaproteobacteria bacterium]|nr:PA0069 family radical SAM protein [Alphaproteobacteria bacterium]
MGDPSPALPRKGRGAISNISSRYDREKRSAVDDGWSRDEDDLPPLRTTVSVDASRSAIVRNQSPDIPFDRSVNPYRGCEHGCIYCFARPTHAYLGLSPGLDFESKLLAKPDAPKLLAEELRRPGYRVEPLALGTNTDPYQPIEREYRITRGLLEVLRDFAHPVMITTKSALVTRDIDILAPMAAKGLAHVALSLTTLDPAVARTMEPRAPRPDRRLDAMRALAAAGIPVAVMTAPIIPALNDWEIERLLEAAAAHGASGAGYVLLRLPLEIKNLFQEWLAAHFPGRAKHILNLIREMRGGKLNQAEFGRRFAGQGPYAAMIRQRFRAACARLGLNKRNDWRLDCAQFKPPPLPGDQLALF